MYLVDCRTKLCNILYARTLNWKLNGGGRHSGVTVLTADPGLAKTQLFRNQSKIAKALVRPLIGNFGKSARDAAATVIYCAAQPGLQENANGRFISNCKIKPLEPYATDDQLAGKLWMVSHRLMPLTKRHAERDESETSSNNDQ